MSSGRGRGRKKGGHEEGHENAERWLLTYADMITLLMVLFIVLFAISQVDQKKFAMLAEGLAAGFANPVAIAPGNQTVLELSADKTAVVDVQDAFPAQIKPNLGKEAASGEAAVQAGKDAAAKAAAADKDALDKAQSLVDSALKKAGMRDRVLLTRSTRGLTVTVIVDDLVFPADSAELGADGARLLAVVAPALAATKHYIAVEGHTNTVNVRPKNYPSEWELSSARASTVVRTLIGLGLTASTLSAVGFADTQPLISPKDPRSIRLNRRVAIVVLSALTPQGGQVGQSSADADSSDPAPAASGATGDESAGQSASAAASSEGAAADGGASDG